MGLPAVATGVPWPLLAGLPAGPRLSRDQAMLLAALTGRALSGRAPRPGSASPGHD
nr:hypothetical protein [Mycobacterium sp. P7213]